MSGHLEREVARLLTFKRQVQDEVERLPEWHPRRPIAEVELLFISTRLTEMGRRLNNQERLGSVIG